MLKAAWIAPFVRASAVRGQDLADDPTAAAHPLWETVRQLQARMAALEAERAQSIDPSGEESPSIDGDDVLRAWNDMGGEARRSVTLAGGAVVSADLEVTEVRRALAHTNEFGRPCSGKST